jgi:hypothetical protein
LFRYRTASRDADGAFTTFIIDARVVEASVLRAGEYVEGGRGTGTDPVDLPPFTGLGLVPDSLWPPRSS